jgi:hypothetical protein
MAQPLIDAPELDYDAHTIEAVNCDDIVDRPNFGPSPVRLKSAAYSRFLTAMPIIAADIIALSAAGAGSLLLCHFATNASQAGIRLSHVTALLPFIGTSYVLAGLYPGVGVHPATELRQLTKLNATVFLAALAVLSLTGAMAAWTVFFCTMWLGASVGVPLLRTVGNSNCGNQLGCRGGGDDQNAPPAAPFRFAAVRNHRSGGEPNPRYAWSAVSCRHQ